MKFLDGVTVKYIRKDQIESYKKVQRKLSEIGETKLHFEPSNSKYFGSYRLEFYIVEEKIPTIKLNGFVFADNPLEWLMNRENQNEIKIKEDFHLVETDFVETFDDVLVKAISAEQFKVYIFVQKEKSLELTLHQLVLEGLKKLFLVLYDEDVDINDYEVELQGEITDYFL